ncbi:transmembrane protein [Nephila pilipes]|uniref:Transmembrane protein n=1 Tax=Nephila pilipes TaxID=299642 RepID=A0A8X6NHX9_NEPPI|nr:transmembrane protein [Nephila pilipes]
MNNGTLNFLHSSLQTFFWKPQCENICVMSSTSIARQNRRKRQRKLPPLPNADATRPHVISIISSSDPSVNNSGSYENSPSVSSEHIGQETNINDSGDKVDNVDVNKSLSAATGCSFIKCDVSSRPIGKVFVEDDRGFKAMDADYLFQTFNNENVQQSSSTVELAINLAHKAEKYFHNFSFLCHGLLGGMSFMETLFLVHLISVSSEQEETLKHFQFLSQPIHNLFNFLCIICCISVFDRYDIGNLKQFFKYVQKCKLKCIVIVIYPICLLLSFSTANVDEKLCLPDKNFTILDSFKFEETDNELFYWKTLSLSKCVGAFLAWIVISLEPNQNLFLYHLKNVLQRNKIIK